MKRGAVLVNIARGALVDSAALAAALRDGVIAGAGLDVTDPEPLPERHPLWAAPNLIVTPHVAGACGPVGGARLAGGRGRQSAPLSGRRAARPWDRARGSSPMKITKLESLHADGGWRTFSFLKLSTDEGLVGWSEYSDGFGAGGTSELIQKFAATRRRHGSARGRPAQHDAPRGDAARRRRPQCPGDRRDRECLPRCEGEGARRSRVPALRRRGPRPPHRLLVALRHVPPALSRILRKAPGQAAHPLARRH